MSDFFIDPQLIPTGDELRDKANLSYVVAQPWAAHLIEHGSSKTLSEIFSVYGNIPSIKEWLLPYLQFAYDHIDIVDYPNAQEYRVWIHTIISDVEYEEQSNPDRRYEGMVRVKETKPHIPKLGYLYVLKAVLPDNYYKIGLSKEPVTRIKSLGVNLPFPIEPLNVFPTNDMVTCERFLHQKFAAKRVNGEWFMLEQTDVDYLLSLRQLNVEDFQ